jgi:glycosyltransferase involved in cell wall biosynthesis
MFQYAQSLLNALDTLPRTEFDVSIAFVDEQWAEMARGFAFKSRFLRWGRFGSWLAQIFMVARLPFQLTRFLNRFGNPLVAELRNMNCDVWIFPAQDALGYQIETSTIVAIHDLMHRFEARFSEVGGGYRYAVREHRFKNLSRKARVLLTDSELGKDQLVNAYGIPHQKVYALPYVAAKSVYEAASEHPVPSEPRGKYFFYPAQFWPHKNHKNLIAAAAVVKAECPDIKLVFAGALKNEYPEIVKFAASLDMMPHVSFLGYVPDEQVVALYQGARALVMPTYLGPTNIPPLEAMICGCPVAVSGIYAMKEQLGSAALYFDPNSVGDIANALRRLWADDCLCEDLKMAGYRRASLWGPEQFSVRFRDILKAALNGAEDQS